MDLRRLTIFLAVVEQGGFTRAADVLGISQPAVSQAIRELEAELGTALFHRLGRAIRLTPAGEALVRPARQVRRDLENGRQAVEEVTGLGTGRLDIGCLPTVVVDPVARLIGAFRLAYPGVALAVGSPEGPLDLLDAVRSGRFEIGVSDEANAEDVTTVGLGSQDFLAVLPPGSGFASAGSIALSLLARQPLVAPPAGSSTRAALDTALEDCGVAARIAVESSQRDALVPLVAAGAGAALLPRPLADLAARAGCVVLRPRPSVRRQLVLIYRATPLTPAAERFVELARADASRRHGNGRMASSL
ncbi:MAG: LysR family transcriptional regulator [Actinomycetota bacterium]|jgi:DNA-binding transcriptional LysR family regulator|nr:LysR family transcriptional regulator [Actinomycetota bacterium]